MNSRDIVKLAAALAASILAALIGSVVTYASLSPWYASLAKPFFTPPQWLFAPAWTALYILMAVALFLVWRLPKGRGRDQALALYAGQIITNALWPIGFFGFHSPMLGVALIVVLLALVLLTAWEFHKLSRPAAYALVPYALWVCFAACLNVAVWLMNP